VSTSVSDVLASLERTRRFKQLFKVGVVAASLLITYFGLEFIGFQLSVILNRLPQFFAFIGEFFPPDFREFTVYTKNNDIGGLRAIPASVANGGEYILESFDSQQLTLAKATVVTLLLGFMGTVIGFPLALTFGVLGSERVTPFPFNFLFRGVMSAIRAIPAIVWIFLYIPLGPPGQVTAVLAIATDTIGNLGRLFTDELEEIDEGPIEAVRSTGGSRAQVVSFGMLSQVSSSYVAWTLYILEINTRIAISLGVVGAGGLGYIIRTNQDSFAYAQTAAGIVMVFIVVLSVELLSSRIRARLRPSEHESKGIVDALRDLGDAGKWLGTGGGGKN